MVSVVDIFGDCAVQKSHYAVVMRVLALVEMTCAMALAVAVFGRKMAGIPHVVLCVFVRCSGLVRGSFALL